MRIGIYGVFVCRGICVAIAGAFLVGITGCFPVEDGMRRTDSGSGYFESQTMAKSSADLFYKEAPVVVDAIAIVHATEGNSVSGWVRFQRVPAGTRVTADLKGLTPGRHGFHIHENGDCRANDGTSAGGHFNPKDRPHSGPGAERRHVGDMGNIVADPSGRAKLDYTDREIDLNGAYTILGRSIVVHAGQDDLASQPSGAAGARVGCGVIGVAKNGVL